MHEDCAIRVSFGKKKKDTPLSLFLSLFFPSLVLCLLITLPNFRMGGVVNCYCVFTLFHVLARSPVELFGGKKERKRLEVLEPIFGLGCICFFYFCFH